MTTFPRQKISASLKNKKFFKDCADAAIELCQFDYDGTPRMSLNDKLIIAKLYHGEIDQEDLRNFAEFNNYETDIKDVRIQHFPIIKPRINLLIGESIKRKKKFLVRAINESAITKKEDTIHKMFNKAMEEFVDLSKSLPDKRDVDNFVAKFMKFKNYESQDILEVVMYHLLNFYIKQLNVYEQASLGFADVLKYSEEIYCIESIGNKPVYRKCNPFSIKVFGLGGSNRIEDASIIVEDNYMPLSQVIDRYYEYLTPAQIDKLEKDNNMNLQGQSAGDFQRTYPNFRFDELFDVGNGFWGAFNGNYNNNGEVRVTRVVFKGFEKLGKRYYINEDGVRKFEVVSEFYKPNKDIGEKVDYYWVNRWYEVTRIRDDIYVKMEARDVPMIKSNGYITNGSGYVGTIYTDNNEKATSMYSELKNYEYLYSILLRDLKKAIKKFKAPMIEVDLAKVPDSFTLDEWFDYADEEGYIIVDSFKESNKGLSQGKLAGSFNTTGKIYNPDIGNYIQHIILFLNFIERQVAYSSGVSDQRLGQITHTETVGGIERSVTQSSHITEPLFNTHMQTILRTIQVLLDTTVQCARNDPSILQYISDEAANYIINLNDEQLSVSDFGIFVTDEDEDKEDLNSLKRLTLEFGSKINMNVKNMMQILTSKSFAEIRNIAIEEDINMREQTAAMAQQQQDQALQALEQQLAIKDKELALKEKSIELDYQMNILKEQMQNDTDISINERNAKLKEYVENLQKEVDMLNLELEKDKLKLMKNNENNKNTKNNK